jgi:predicted short-subunit dehydrogenase-like oxidoreductase (DUF2520 family)
MRIAVVGAGRVGTAVAVLLRRAGHRIVAVSGGAATRGRAGSHLPDVPFVDPVGAATAAELLLIGTPDDAIASVAAEVASAIRPGTWVAHLSGSLGLDALEPVRAAGARRLAIHPLQTLPDVGTALERLPGSWIAIAADDDEGYGLAERIAHDLHGRPFRLPDELRPLYHAAAVFASNFVVATSAVAEELFAAAGVPEPRAAMTPLQQATLANVERSGPAAALTGPAVRGDAGTIGRNLEALKQHAPEAVALYVALARATLDLADRSGRLGPGARRAVEEVLDVWS